MDGSAKRDFISSDVSEGEDVMDLIGSYKMQPTVMETFTGRYVDVKNIWPEDVEWRTVAHALSLTCRYGGHCRVFFSVAEHSIYCHDEAVRRLGGRSGLSSLREVCLAALLHDGGEAYWHDLGRPLKNAEGMEGYHRYLDAAQQAVFDAFLPSLAHKAEREKRWLKRIDDSVLKTEVRRLMPSRGKDWVSLEKIEAAPIPWWRWMWFRMRPPAAVERAFLRRLSRYVDVE